ncbi:hypothetical protein LAWI1_G003790, partial [Lachnellula willkommii]
MSLEDIIDYTISLQEVHLSSILFQIARALYSLQEVSAKDGLCLVYGSLRASNVFLTREGKVQLAAFGAKVSPDKRTAENCYRDCWDLGALANHMISRRSDKPITSVMQQKMLSVSITGKSLDVKFEPSLTLVDFLELCFADTKNLLMEKVLRVTSFFTREQLPRTNTISIKRQMFCGSALLFCGRVMKDV